MKRETKQSKVAVHTVETLQAVHTRKKTGYKVIAVYQKTAKLKCTNGHTFESRKDYNRRCPVCFPNLFASRERTQDQYVDWLKEHRPELRLVGTYTTSKAKTDYKHTTCKNTFSLTPDAVARKTFKCPKCAPKACASYRTFKRGKTSIEVRGKEVQGLEWILNNTSIKVSEIEVDSDGTVPKIPYKAKNRTQTYRPDFFVRNRNLLVEVKDCRTLGLGDTFFYVAGEQLWKTNCAKAKACIEAGFKFQMLLFDRNNERIKLPKFWYTMTRKQILKHVAPWVI